MENFEFEYTTQSYNGLKFSAKWEAPLLVVYYGDFVFVENEINYTLDKDVIASFVETMITLTHWDKKYEDEMVFDGCNWSVKFKQGKYNISSEGYQSWPEDFIIFENAISVLTEGKYNELFS